MSGHTEIRRVKKNSEKSCGAEMQNLLPFRNFPCFIGFRAAMFLDFLCYVVCLLVGFRFLLWFCRFDLWV